MRILFVLPAYEPAWPLGGVVRCTSTLCRGLAAAGHAVTVYTTNASGTSRPLSFHPGQLVDQGGVSTFYFSPTFGCQSVFDSRALVRHLRQTVKTYDLVYISAVWQWIGVEAASTCVAAGVPMVTGLHGSLDEKHLEHSAWTKRAYWHLWLRDAVRRSTAIHLTTEYERDQTARLVGDLPSFVIPNGLDLRSFGCDGQSRRAFREKWGIPAAAFVVTSVGRPDPIKRTSLLIEALARVPTGDTDWRALFVGPTDGAETRIWRKLIHDRGIADRVIWTGTLAGSDLLSAYAASDMLCSLSRDENFGMVVIEALACGLPVLATSSVGVWNEIAEEGVGETTTADPQDIAARIWSAMRSRETWSARGARGPFLVRERFSSSRVDSLMVRAFTDILTGQQSAECRWANWPRRTSAQGS